MTVDSKIVDKIQKLLAHAAGTDNEAESNAFLEKAQRLMMEHAVDQEMLKARDAEQTETITTREVIIPKKSPVTNGMRDLLHMCAINNRCRMYYNERRGTGSVVGYEGDAHYAVLLYVHLLNQMEFEMMVEQGVSGVSGVGPIRTFKANFTQSYASRIGSRLREMNMKVAPDVNTPDGNSMALVLVKRKAEVDRYVDDNLKLRSGQRGSMNYSAAGQAGGRAAADRADIAGARGTTGRLNA